MKISIILILFELVSSFLNLKMSDHRFVKNEKKIEIKHKSKRFNRIKGFFGQIGSNPKYITDNSHFFDGDGMIHGVFFEDKKLTYQNHWVRTKKLITEEKWGKPMYLSISDLKGFEGILKIIGFTILNNVGLIPTARGTANTAIFNYNNRTFALHEGDMPYEIDINYKNKSINTISQINFNGIKSITAHPKIDNNNKNKIYMYGYNSYDFMNGMFYNNIFDKNFSLIERNHYSLINNGIIHDIAQTENNIIIPDLPLKCDFNKILKGEIPLYFDKNGTSRFGTISKESGNITWYNSEKNFFLFHFSNSFETKKEIIVYGCLMDNVHLDDFSIKCDKEKLEGNLRLKKIIINKKNKKFNIVENKYLDNLNFNFSYNLDFPLKSNKNRNINYLTIFDSNSTKIMGYLKINLYNFINSKPKIYLLNNRYGNSEPQIITIGKKEYLLSFTYDEKINYISIIDIDLNKIYDIKLPKNILIPPGFHSTFINY